MNIKLCSILARAVSNTAVKFRAFGKGGNCLLA